MDNQLTMVLAALFEMKTVVGRNQAGIHDVKSS